MNIFKCKKNVSLDCLKISTKQRRRHKTVFYCCCSIQQQHLKELEIRHCMWLCRSEGIAIENAEEADESKLCYELQTIKNPTVPYLGKIPDVLYLGRTITIRGKVNEVGESFAINFINEEEGNRNVTFHFNPRFDRKIVVRNYRKNDVWGVEEISTCSQFPFVRGRGFRITFFIADNKVMVAVNRRHYCSFIPRIAMDETNILEIIGCVTVNLIKFESSLFYPILPVSPYPRIILPCWRHTKLSVQRKVCAIIPGTKIAIRGKVKLLPQSFYVNLQSGATEIPHPLIPLHINLRLCQMGFGEQQMIYNSWFNGCWGDEVKLTDSPFMPGSVFSILIQYFETGFHVSVNGEFSMAFPMRLPHPPVLDTLLVHGDVFISNVKISSMSTDLLNN